MHGVVSSRAEVGNDMALGEVVRDVTPFAVSLEDRFNHRLLLSLVRSQVRKLEEHTEKFGGNTLARSARQELGRRPRAMNAEGFGIPGIFNFYDETRSCSVYIIKFHVYVRIHSRPLTIRCVHLHSSQCQRMCYCCWDIEVIEKAVNVALDHN
jgi:hypothetical protein